ncbi:MAG: menaquinone biosynthetic enzyme MqnA/MqnD family protein [Pirellula sp.]|jgi:chorismate dehydratase
MVTTNSNLCSLLAKPEAWTESTEWNTRESGTGESEKGANKPLSSSNQFVRVGAVSYLNSKPLIYGLADDLAGIGCLTTDLPSRLADQIKAGVIDVGLIPAFEYLKTPGLRLVSSSAIVSRGPVWSVRLFFRTEPAKVKRVALDEGSRTSAALSKLLMHETLGIRPETQMLPMQEDPENVDADAVLLIGDRAMHPENYERSFQLSWDLGEKWFQWTGLPFVFAGWVTRESSIDESRLGRILDGAKVRGRRDVQKISRDCCESYGLTVDKCLDYLTNYIFFDLNQDAVRGLEEFRRRCQRAGLIEPNAVSSNAEQLNT